MKKKQDYIVLEHIEKYATSTIYRNLKCIYNTSITQTMKQQ